MNREKPSTKWDEQASVETRKCPIASFFYYSRPTEKMTSCAWIPFSQQSANSRHTRRQETSGCLVNKLLIKQNTKTKGKAVQSHDFTGHAQTALLPVFSAVELFHAIMSDLTDERVKSILNSLKNKQNRQRIFFSIEDVCLVWYYSKSKSPDNEVNISKLH